MLTLPMIIHIRDAASRARSIVDEHGYYSGVLHCFSADKKLAEWAVEKGLFISFSGNITYGEERLGDFVKTIPCELLMVETDAPYLAPAPNRGQRSEPADRQAHGVFPGPLPASWPASWLVTGEA